MNRKLRLLLSAAVAAGTIFVAAPPAQAYCAPDDGVTPEGCRCEADKLNSVSRKLLGQDMFACPM